VGATHEQPPTQRDEDIAWVLEGLDGEDIDTARATIAAADALAIRRT